MPEQLYEVLLQDDEAAQAHTIAAIESAHGARVERLFPDKGEPLDDFYAVTLAVEGNPWDVARELYALDGVIEVDPVLDGERSLINRVLFGPRDYRDVSDDPTWNHALTRFDAAVATSIQQGKLAPEQGSGLTIAHLDTGYTDHPELDRMAKLRGKNYVQPGPTDDALDPLVDEGFWQQPGHGTATAGVIIGDRTEVAGDRNDGVFPYVTLAPYRVSNSVINLVNRRIARAVIDAVDAGCDVITMSMGGTWHLSWKSAAAYAREHGVVWVCAAGNWVREVVWPARFPNVIAAAAVNCRGEPWEGSCSGGAVEISAPGESVFVPRTPLHGTYHYDFGSGTSFAAPHVAAAAALWLNHYAETLARPVYAHHKHLRVDLFREALRRSAKTPDHWTDREKARYGAGVLDAEALLRQTPPSCLVSLERWRGGDAGARDFVEEAPSLVTRELMHLVLHNDLPDAEVEGYVLDQASAIAREAFDALASRGRDLGGLEEADPDRLRGPKGPGGLRGSYMEMLTSGV